MESKYPFKPLKLKMVEPINVLSKYARTGALKDADFNLFKIPADKITLDFLTDSGTGALSDKQWSQMMLGDESYASAKSWQRFEDAVQKFTGKKQVIPVHQGRAAEKIIAEVFLKKGDIVLANTLFDTTRANFEYRGAKCIDLPAKKSANLFKSASFKGDMDLEALRFELRKNKDKAKLIVMTLTNNSGGGQPASFANVEKVAEIAKKAGVPFLIDSCRIAENSYFVWCDEMNKKGKVATIVRKTYGLADLSHMSAKKDGLANVGGFIVTNNKQWAEKLRELAILYEGYSTYGGMSGRDIETIAVGLGEVVDHSYLAYRTGQTAYLHKKLAQVGIPLVHPAGGHAVYIDAKAFLPHIPKEQFPAHALAVELYKQGGIRSVEIGSLMFGGHARHELVRLAIPRRVYVQSHFDYTAAVFKEILKNRKKIKGYKIIWESKTLRHFSCKLRPV